MYMSHEANEWVIANESHGARMDESCLIYKWVMSHIQMSHVSYTNESCLIYKWVMSDIRMSHVAYSNKSWMNESLRMSHGVRANEPCLTHKESCINESLWVSHCEWVMAYMWMRHVSCTNGDMCSWHLIYRALLQIRRALLRACRAVLRIYRARTCRHVMATCAWVIMKESWRWVVAALRTSHGMSHVSYTNESGHTSCTNESWRNESLRMSHGMSPHEWVMATCKWVMGRTDESLWRSHVLDVNESCRMYEWVMGRMSHGANGRVTMTCLICEWVMSHVRMSHGDM